MHIKGIFCFSFFIIFFFFFRTIEEAISFRQSISTKILLSSFIVFFWQFKKEYCKKKIYSYLFCAWNSLLYIPSASTSLIISWSSASVGFCPSDLITVPNSFVVIVPSPSLSNNENASYMIIIFSRIRRDKQNNKSNK